MTGGRTRDGGDIVGASVFYSQPPASPRPAPAAAEDEISRLDAEIKEGEAVTAEAAAADQQLSSLVWICTSTHSISKVTVIDANNPADVLECFHVCSSHLLCIASVPGNVSRVPVMIMVMDSVLNNNSLVNFLVYKTRFLPC